MLRVNSIGQYQAPYTGPAQSLNPVLYAALESAGVVLSQTDPGAPQTIQYIERIIAAPPMFSSSASAGGPAGPAKLSDIDSVLRPIVFVRENPVVTLLGLVAIPMVVFFVGRAVGLRSRSAR